jgi:glycosyltransferase involved in cell wall biosynthesis
MEPLGVGVVIPVLNEGASIAAVISEIPRDVVREIIVVDGGSSDGTAEIAAAAGARVIVLGQHDYGRACLAGGAASDHRVHGLRRRQPRRSDRSYRRADMAGQVRLLSSLLALAANASRGSMAWHQLLAGHLAGIGMRVLYGVRYTDMCAYRAIHRDCLDRLGMREMTYGWNIEIQMKAARSGLRILEVPMPYRRRSGGESRVAGTVRGSLRAGWRIIATFLRVAATPARDYRAEHR